MNIRAIAAAAAAVVLALMLALSPASAKRCDDDTATCPQPSGPMMLEHFMKTWKPVATSSHRKYRTSQASRRQAAQELAAKRETSAAETKPAKSAAIEPPPPAEQPTTKVASAEPAAETDGVAVASFSEANELDTAADRVQVVAFNEINDIDLTAPPSPAPVETVGQSVSPEQPSADYSWIGKLLLAAAGTLALAGATRVLLA
jgi:hypothetical protein